MSEPGSAPFEGSAFARLPVETSAVEGPAVAGSAAEGPAAEDSAADRSAIERASERPAADRQVVRARRLVSRAELADAIAPTILIHALLVVFAWLAIVVDNPEALGGHDPLELWNRWDAPHIIEVAQRGYDPSGDPARIVIFPLMPLMVRVGSLLLAPHIAGMAIALVASVFAALGLYRLARLDAGRAIGRAAVLAMNLFPTAYVLVAPYTEAPFLAFTVWSVLAARAGRWPRAGILAALAAATRIQGAFLIPALAAVYLASGLRLERRAAWLLAPCLSLLAYLGINAWVFGNPLFFLQVQEQVFHVETQVPWLTVQDLVRAVTSTSVDSFWATVYLAPLAAIVLVLAVAAWTITRARSRPDDAIVACLNAISLAALSWPISVPRYLVGVYPIDLALARIIRMRSVGLVLGAGSTLLLGLYTLQFTLGRWAF